MPKPYVDEDACQRFILVMMYEAFVQNERTDFTPARLQQRLSVPLNIVAATLNEMEDHDLVEEVEREVIRTVGLMQERVRERVGTGAYRLTRGGRDHVRKMADEAYDLCLARLAAGSAAGAIFAASPKPDAPKAPDAWSPLPIELGDPEVEAVREALDDVLSAVQSENGYAESHPEERAEILAALSAAKTMFTHAGQFGYASFVAYIVTPAEQLLKRFDRSTVVGGVVSVFVEGVKSWVKTKIGLALDDVFRGLK